MYSQNSISSSLLQTWIARYICFPERYRISVSTIKPYAKVPGLNRKGKLNFIFVIGCNFSLQSSPDYAFVQRIPPFCHCRNTSETDFLESHLAPSVIVSEFQSHTENESLATAILFREKEEIRRNNIRLVRRAGDHGHVISGQKLLR